MAEQVLHTMTIAADGNVQLRRHPLEVVITKGPDRKNKGLFEEDRIVIGTHPNCDFVLTDGTASRQHCEVILVRGGYRVRDLGSKNGTYVANIQVSDVVIRERTTLRLGNTILTLGPAKSTVDLKLAERTSYGPLLGKSVAMRRLYDQLERVAPSNTTVLLTGESGTGKEVCARAIHEGSARKAGPFVVVDCGALAENLIESELYGHERGAFTGAHQSQSGAFVNASGGTVFSTLR